MYADKAAAAQVSDFRLDTYEVTVERFRAFVNAGMGTSATPPAPGAGAHARIHGSGWDPAWNANLEINTEGLVAALNCDSTYQTWKDASITDDNQPINCLTWYEAMAFCIWDGGYLPSEAEWNYAASGGSEQRPYPWASDGSTTVDCSYANYTVDIAHACVEAVTGATNRVGSESPKGDGRWGQADLAGNLFEWNLDWFTDTYPGPPCSDCANLADATSRTSRVYRGGAFAFTASALRVAVRTGDQPAERSYVVGVRCARTP
jgi:formylglycine-generating enzyme required for sulfatase activity